MIIRWSMQCGACAALWPVLSQYRQQSPQPLLLLPLTGDRMINMIKVGHGETRKASVHQFRANTIFAATRMPALVCWAASQTELGAAPLHRCSGPDSLG